jgi:hypothetical protein
MNDYCEFVFASFENLCDLRRAEGLTYQSLLTTMKYFLLYIQYVPREEVNILGDYRIGHSKQKSVYGHVSYCERLPR